MKVDLLSTYSKKSNAQLEYIVRYPKEHMYEVVITAKSILEERYNSWRIKNQEITAQLDKEIRKHGWFDFHVISYDHYNLTIGGNYDLTYYHALEIVFEDVFFVSCFFSGWRSNTNDSVFQIPSNEKELNKKYSIEDGYQLFSFNVDDDKRPILIAARNISFNTDAVYYYPKTDLNSNERIASFTKNRPSSK